MLLVMSINLGKNIKYAGTSIFLILKKSVYYGQPSRNLLQVSMDSLM